MNNAMNTITFNKTKCSIILGCYSNGRPAIELVNQKTNEPILAATINLPLVSLSDKEVIIKNYSENEGILDVLIYSNIISEPIKYIETGLVLSPVCRILQSDLYK